MAAVTKRLPANAPGELFVDSTCIDCAACRWIAPATFDAHGGYSRVRSQPETAGERRRALMALVACPTGSIGSGADKAMLAQAASAFPDPIDGGVYHCGFHSPKSYGAASWLIVRARGNVLVDSPRFNRGLVQRIEQLGGVRTMFLTHRDDVADHARFAAHFGCRRVIHRRDVTTETKDVEELVDGDDPTSLDDDLLVIPTPGHTAGSACLLYRERFLFSGDHAAWSARRGHVYAFRDACWYDWRLQIDSMKRLTAMSFEWLLPGHGAPIRLEPADMRASVGRCVAWMQSVG